MYCLGEQSNAIFSTGKPENNRKKYTEVMSKFDKHFRVRKNIICKQACFNRRNQLPGEMAKEYIAAVLLNLVDSYNLEIKCYVTA